jgi:3-hydroxyacyl-[acyl-carrier-protein] dehydratase
MDFHGEVEAWGDDHVTVTSSVDAGAPVFRGHYPHFPILPGIYVVEAALQAVEQHAQRGGARVRLRSLEALRLHSPVRPGDRLTCEARRRVAPSRDGAWDVVCRVGTVKAAKVTLVVEEA